MGNIQPAFPKERETSLEKMTQKSIAGALL